MISLIIKRDMMRFYILLILIFLSCRSYGEVFFVPGWRTGYSAREGCVRILRDVYPGKKIVVKSWDSLQSWEVTKHNAQNKTARLTAELIKMPENERRELILVGHSIGAGIVVDVLCELSRRKMRIHSVALLGGALPDDDPRIPRVLDAIRYYCSIVYNPDDWVLKYIFPLDIQLRSPLGLNGWSGQDYRVFEAKARSDRFGFCNHYAYIYLEELDRLVEKLPPELPEVKVMQDEKNIERRPADEIYWNTIGNYGNWQLQQSCFDENRCRILDDRGIRRATGSREKMRAAFEDLCRQLKIERK